MIIIIMIINIIIIIIIITIMIIIIVPSLGEKLSEGESNSSTIVAIQRAQDLERELESYVQQNEQMSARIETLESNMLNMQLRSRLSDGVNTKKSDNDYYSTLLTVWGSLGKDSIHSFVHICKYICMWVIYTLLYIHMYIYLHTDMFMYTCIYIYTMSVN
jgi:DNA-binding HxlR family transcriptional regulator